MNRISFLNRGYAFKGLLAVSLLSDQTRLLHVSDKHTGVNGLLL